MDGVRSEFSRSRLLLSGRTERGGCTTGRGNAQPACTASVRFSKPCCSGCNFAESLFEIGELDRAESHLDSAFAHLKAHGEMWLAPEVHRVRLMLLRAQAAPDEVLRHPIGIGLDLARSQGARLLEIRFAACVARLWRDRGEKDRARAILDPVYGWFTEGFDTADLKEAKALLDELR